MPKRPTDHPAEAASARNSSSAAKPASAIFPPSPDTPTPLLGNLTPSQFMRRYWQKKPLLIRQAIPNVEAPLSRDELFELADEDDVEARLITHFRNKWQLEHGPFAPDELPSLKRRAWTLLVQGADLHDDRARALLDRFRFVPDARLDDLMISYATDGGGVGPHFDSYDVFLLQVKGKRRWRISAQKDLTLQPDLPLKVLQNFEAEQEWVLEPGDMLYLPPHIAHDGVAEGECMTCSIGFRAPSAGELTAQFLYYLAERGEENGRTGALYRDPQQPAVDRPAELPAALVERVGAILAEVRWNEQDIASFLGTYLSEPKPSVVFDPPQRPLNEVRFISEALKSGVRLDRKTSLLYNRRFFFINGEKFPSGGSKKWLFDLADHRCLSAKRFVTLSHDSSVTARLHEWYRAGWIRMGELA
ncbi:cupin domain-containing protein [Paraburkholderia graminis]|jgi:50S ribosomal protein L16 3-hydroxylase|uniref:50S ribosomal protein L16 3-hydroxylase n=1 Tax=Paraburkholderia graminis TaxID=60548 RepID=A0ABD5CFX1_9BURK|nr:cupin domain-containing protein [Paraburkholderia graminis]MDQ0623621.1 50S ribosomal protein L16 3-hydroxylase [Paraburkholderia graminis]MDR6203445.1 50S ribosomal protein L16 3-hydroxylase [Paraburkholderia graminis]